ncbi:MAG: hypothetical protein J7L61_04475 [Thermoplasmata archaeon]|nr:hypothetical protein [Thermoplasmata archaeon]
MKCAVHNDRDAVGVCVHCGGGVCTECRVVLGGRIFCKRCAETVTDPRAVFPGASISWPAPEIPRPMIPRPKGVPKRYFFNIGKWGALLGSVGLLVLGSSVLFLFLVSSNTLIYIMWGVGVPGAAIYGAGILMLSCGAYGFYRNYGSTMGLGAFLTMIILGSISLVLFVGGMVTSIHEYENYLGETYYYVDDLFYVLTLIAAMFMGISFIVYGISVLMVRRIFPNIRIPTAVGILSIVGGALFPLWLFMAPWIILFVAMILSSSMFRDAPLPGLPAQGMFGGHGADGQASGEPTPSSPEPRYPR